MSIGTYNFTTADYKILDAVAETAGYCADAVDQLSMCAVQNTYDVAPEDQMDVAIGTMEMYVNDPDCWPLGTADMFGGYDFIAK